MASRERQRPGFCAMWTIAKKEWRLLSRDPRAGIILIAMPFVFILVLGLSLGEGFGQKPDDRLRISLVDLDQGYVEPKAILQEVRALFTRTPQASGVAAGVDGPELAVLTLAGST